MAIINPLRILHGDSEREASAQRLNWLRAGVLGANDGIVSVAAIAVGVAGVTTALGEYVSVSGQRDGERAQHARSQRGAGADACDSAPRSATEPEDVVSPWHAAFASAGAFLVGGIIPLLAILLPPETWRVPITFAVVLAALAATGVVGAQLGGGSRTRAAIRVVIGGALALAATFTIGAFLGTSGVL